MCAHPYASACSRVIHRLMHLIRSLSAFRCISQVYGKLTTVLVWLTRGATVSEFRGRRSDDMPCRPERKWTGWRANANSRPSDIGGRLSGHQDKNRRKLRKLIWDGHIHIVVLAQRGVAQCSAAQRSAVQHTNGDGDRDDGNVGGCRGTTSRVMEP